MYRLPLRLARSCLSTTRNTSSTVSPSANCSTNRRAMPSPFGSVPLRGNGTDAAATRQEMKAVPGDPQVEALAVLRHPGEEQHRVQGPEDRHPAGDPAD